MLFSGQETPCLASREDKARFVRMAQYKAIYRSGGQCGSISSMRYLILVHESVR